jgi:amino acid transporter
MNEGPPVSVDVEIAPGVRADKDALSEATVKLAQPTQYDLKHHILSPLETLAQSVSAIAPSASPTLTVPLVFALAGEGTWLAYVIAIVCIGLVALCVAAFARDSASPGSLYAYVRSSLHPAVASIAAWALLFAYVLTAASLIGGFINYAYVLLGDFGKNIPAILFNGIATGGAVWLAQRDVKMSTRVMLWIEGVSVCLISFVVGLTVWQHGLHVDAPQLHLQGATTSGVRLGVMLALFSFVGFESATALGAEAREPLKTIPRAVIRSALLAGLFFLVCAYGEVIGFRGAASGLGESTAPLRYLSEHAGVKAVGLVIDVCVLVSMFACTLACIIAAARVLMLMAHHGLAHGRLSVTHSKKQTPVAAGFIAGVAAFLIVAGLSLRGVGAADIYGWAGTLSVYGFLTVYGLVAVALPIHLKRMGKLGVSGIALSAITTIAMILALVGNLYPLPPSPIRYFPYVYALYLVCGIAWFYYSPRERPLAY